MKWGCLTRGTIVFAAVFALDPAFSIASPQQTAPPVATFKSSIALVRVSAVVRDHKGRFVQDLTARDFEILDGGLPRRITDFRSDLSGVSVALLFEIGRAHV